LAMLLGIELMEMKNPSEERGLCPKTDKGGIEPKFKIGV